MSPRLSTQLSTSRSLSTPRLSTLPVEEEHLKVDISQVDRVDTVDMEEAVHSSKVDTRREYEREYERKKRAEAKAAEGAE